MIYIRIMYIYVSHAIVSRCVMWKRNQLIIMAF